MMKPVRNRDGDEIFDLARKSDAVIERAP